MCSTSSNAPVTRGKLNSTVSVGSHGSSLQIPRQGELEGGRSLGPRLDTLESGYQSNSPANSSPATPKSRLQGRVAISTGRNNKYRHNARNWIKMAKTGLMDWSLLILSSQELNNPVPRRATKPLAQGKDLQTKISQAEIQTWSWQLVRGDPGPGSSNLWR